MINDLISLFDTYGAEKYDENISQTEHAVQCALLAQQNSASKELIVASLLHDVGHLLQLQNNNGSSNFSFDDLHENLGETFLSASFGQAVTRPIALHVQAKRYLCSTVPAYLDQLSEGSRRSLALQGGLMNEEETRQFALADYSGDAISLRTWDDTAKIENLTSGQFKDFVPLLEQVVKQ